MGNIAGHHIGLGIAGLGVALWGIDAATPKTTPCPSGTYCGAVYGPGSPLNAVVTATPIDPTILIVGIGLAIWAWQKYGK
jgi:hypothetical protein